MKQKKAGFSIIELLIVVTVMGILATLVIPLYVSRIAESRDTERLTNVESISQLVLLDQTVRSKTYTRASLEQMLAAQGTGFPKPVADYCYVFGQWENDFFVAVRSEKNVGSFIVDGTKTGKSEFVNETRLLSEIGDCDPLTAPTEWGDYQVFYLQ